RGAQARLQRVIGPGSRRVWLQPDRRPRRGAGLRRVMASIAVAGSIAQRAGYGGHAWALIQYLLGFRSLGYEVVFIDFLSSGMATDERGVPSPTARARSIDWFTGEMRRAGLEGSYALLLGENGHSVGLSRAEVLERAARSRFLLNVMGFIDDEEILEAAPRR